MAAKYLLTESAAREIERIAIYLSSDRQPHKAVRVFVEGLAFQLELACPIPESRPVCPHPEFATRGYRSFKIGRYFAIYLIAPDCVRALHVFHQSQNYVHDALK